MATPAPAALARYTLPSGAARPSRARAAPGAKPAATPGRAQEEGQRRRLRRGFLRCQEVSSSACRFAGSGSGSGGRSLVTSSSALPPSLPSSRSPRRTTCEGAGYFPASLASCAERWPIVTHGLTMSLGGVDPIPPEYLATLAAFARDVRTPWHSDHLCFTVAGGVVTHELLPLPFTAEAAEHVAVRVMRAQDALGIPMAVENISYYAHPGDTGDGRGRVRGGRRRRAGCSLLLDVNNVYVNAQKSRLRRAGDDRQDAARPRRADPRGRPRHVRSRAHPRHPRRGGPRRGLRSTRLHIATRREACRCCSSATTTSRLGTSSAPRSRELDAIVRRVGIAPA